MITGVRGLQTHQPGAVLPLVRTCPQEARAVLLVATELNELVMRPRFDNLPLKNEVDLVASLDRTQTMRS
jgi:hypothetical protein